MTATDPQPPPPSPTGWDTEKLVVAGFLVILNLAVFAVAGPEHHPDLDWLAAQRGWGYAMWFDVYAVVTLPGRWAAVAMGPFLGPNRLKQTEDHGE